MRASGAGRLKDLAAQFKDAAHAAAADAGKSLANA